MLHDFMEALLGIHIREFQIGLIHQMGVRNLDNGPFLCDAGLNFPMSCLPLNLTGQPVDAVVAIAVP